jgi:hypothetical protein
MNSIDCEGLANSGSRKCLECNAFETFSVLRIVERESPLKHFFAIAYGSLNGFFFQKRELDRCEKSFRARSAAQMAKLSQRRIDVQK